MIRLDVCDLYGKVHSSHYLRPQDITSITGRTNYSGHNRTAVCTTQGATYYTSTPKREVAAALEDVSTLTAQRDKAVELLKRIKIDMDGAVCDCGHPLSETDAYDLVNEFTTELENTND